MPLHTDPKPGIHTTEFWLTLIASITALAATHFEAIEGSTGVISAAILTAIYTIARAHTKKP